MKTKDQNVCMILNIMGEYVFFATFLNITMNIQHVRYVVNVHLFIHDAANAVALSSLSFFFGS